MLNKTIPIELINQQGAHCMIGHLGIEITEIGDDYVCAKMPVDHRTHQPYGLLHGGASVVLAESLGSFGAALSVDMNLYNCVGQEINANHIRSVREGFVFGKATLLHAGKQSQIWDIRITDEAGKLVCISRLTMAILLKKQP